MPALEIASEESTATPDLTEEHVRRVLNSPSFVRAETQRRLLEYLWTHRSESLSEYALATEALGRKADFDSAADASVRVHISRLRRKLKDYYQQLGEPEVLTIPTGTHQLVVGVTTAPVELEPSPLPVLPSAPTPEPRRTLLLPVLVTAVLCLLVAGTVGWYAGKRTLAAAKPRPTQFWSDFLARNGSPIKIILPTPVFFKFSDLRIRSTRVNDFGEAASDPAFRALTQQLGPPSLEQHYTTTSDTLAAVGMARYLDSFGGRDRVSFDVMRNSDMLVLEQSNVIAVGTYQTLHPMHQYLEAMNFSLNHDELAALNAKPLPGEQSSYPFVEEAPERYIRPSIIALLPGRSPGLQVLIIESRDTAALISLLSSSAGDNSVQAMLRARGNPKFWEMVVQTEMNNDHALRAWPVAVHTFPSSAPSSAM